MHPPCFLLCRAELCQADFLHLAWKEGAGSLQTGVERQARDLCHTPVSCVTHLLLVVTGVCHTSGFCVTHFKIVCHTSVFCVTHFLLEFVTLLCHLYHTSLVFHTSVLCVTCFNIVYHTFLCFVLLTFLSNIKAITKVFI